MDNMDDKGKELFEKVNETHNKLMQIQRKIKEPTYEWVKAGYDMIEAQYNWIKCRYRWIKDRISESKVIAEKYADIGFKQEAKEATALYSKLESYNLIYLDWIQRLKSFLEPFKDAINRYQASRLMLKPVGMGELLFFTNQVNARFGHMSDELNALNNEKIIPLVETMKTWSALKLAENQFRGTIITEEDLDINKNDDNID